MHIKCINGWSDKSCGMLLKFLKDVFPICEKLPTSYYDAKKVVKDLGLHYEKIDVCENNCVIYYKELADAYECPTCSKGPGNDIDVYMRPLIDELKYLLEIGIETFDISTKQNFQMKAAVLWTINDFPAYAYMPGWSTKGKLACPYCASKTGENKISGMKTHDCHVFFERLLQLIVREMLPRHVSDAVIELCIHNLDEIHRLEFVGWFNRRITQLYKEGQVCKHMLSLARGPENREGRGYKRDRYGIVTVNIKLKLNTRDTFVLACQANQVYYTKGLLDNTWNAVNEIKPRNLYEIPIDGEPYQEVTQFNSTNVNQEGNENEEDEIDWSRVEADVMIVE
ncbi:hypothetical protein Ddye_026564 [Dipteronia dyeriana]|uniref:DUF4216 domain-containing protein n=1 Tax=Dipteronia dyeriana TaxID=168575 RepID=A0AAD9TME4_9ROSI|nr:hypothetical protein Ddye_026564 [Dipteronia dyeriana]